MIRRYFSTLLKPPKFAEAPMHLFPRASVVRFKVATAEEPSWLTKRMKDLELCSRSQAEKFVLAGMVKVNGSRVLENLKVESHSTIELARRTDVNTKKIPLSEGTKLWVFYKPQKFTTTLVDPYKRHTVYHYLDRTDFPRIEVYTIGHLDYFSEGIMLLTNNKDLAEATEFSASHVLRRYEARVNGRVTTELLENIKKGISFSMKKYRPIHVWTRKTKQKSKNVWVGAALEKSHPRELRSIFERKKMHVNRLIRTHYGPYKLFGLKPGEFKPVDIHINFHKLLFKYYKDKSLKQ